MSKTWSATTRQQGEWKIYYICRDYLGSICAITEAGGQAVAEYSYDAWGNLRDPETHRVYAPDEQPELFLGRGFTGHEHLQEYGLINMNARLYDPVVGRFLSPDPYVQNPENTQSYNRYSYALNNPLKYTDPSGEIGKPPGYTYNWRTGLYENENGDWVPWEEVYNWLNATWKFQNPGNANGWGSRRSHSGSSTSLGSGSVSVGSTSGGVYSVGDGWNVDDFWLQNTLYINTSTQQIRFLLPHLGEIGSTLFTHSIIGNLALLSNMPSFYKNASLENARYVLNGTIATFNTAKGLLQQGLIQSYKGGGDVLEILDSWHKLDKATKPLKFAGSILGVTSVIDHGSKIIEAYNSRNTTSMILNSGKVALDLVFMLGKTTNPLFLGASVLYTGVDYLTSKY